MSDSPTPATAEIFDLATGLDTLAVGSTPAESFAMLDGAMTQATGMALYNAITAQQRDSTARMAAVTMSCATLLAYPLGALGDAPAAAAASPEGAATPAAKVLAVGETAAPAAEVPANSLAPGGGPARTVDSQVTDAINKVTQAVLSPQAVRASGTGKAYQLAALTAALTVLDATEALRGVSTIATAASGVALASSWRPATGPICSG